MKYLFLSDLHLGNPLFECTDELIDLIEQDKFDELVLVGDILDEWEANVISIYNNNSRLIETINIVSLTKPVIYIIGNHDPNSEDIQRVFPQADIHYTYPIDGGVVTHGHDYDILITKFSIIARLWHLLSWFTERLFRFSINNWVTRTYLSIAALKEKKYYGDLVTEVGENVVDAYKDIYTFAVIGHTHYPIIDTIDEFTYVNCGDIIHSFTYVTYDSDTKKFELNYLK